MKTKNGGEERAHVIFLRAKDENREGSMEWNNSYSASTGSALTQVQPLFLSHCAWRRLKNFEFELCGILYQSVWCWQNQCGNLDWWPLNLPTSQYQCGISLKLLCDQHYNWVQTRKPPTAVQKKGMFIFGGISCWSSLAVRFLWNKLGKGLCDWAILANLKFKFKSWSI